MENGAFCRQRIRWENTGEAPPRRRWGREGGLGDGEGGKGPLGKSGDGGLICTAPLWAVNSIPMLYLDPPSFSFALSVSLSLSLSFSPSLSFALSAYLSRSFRHSLSSSPPPSHTHTHTSTRTHTYMHTRTYRHTQCALAYIHSVQISSLTEC